MNLEKISADKNQTSSKNENAKIAEAYYKQFPEGLVREAERALQQTTRLEYLKSEEAPEELREVYEKIIDIMDVPSKHICTYTQKILEVIKSASAQYSKTHKDCDGYDYDMSQMRDALKEQGIPIKRRVVSSDFQ